MKVIKIMILIVLIIIVILVGSIYFINNKNTSYDENNMNQIDVEEKNEDNIDQVDVEERNEEEEKQSRISKLEDFYNDFKKVINTNNIELIRNKIYNTYFNVKFNTDKEFNEYIANNMENWLNGELDISKFDYYENDEFNEYICQDNMKNYYIFMENKDTGEYSVLLDIYTIKIDWLETKFSSASNIDKASIMMEKIVNMINNKDYKNLYEKIQSDMRETFFKEYNDFEIYANEAFRSNTSFNIMKIASFGDKTRRYNVDLLEDTTKYAAIVIMSPTDCVDSDEYEITFEI